MNLLVILLVASVSLVNIGVAYKCQTCMLFNNSCYNVTHVVDLDAPYDSEIGITKIGILRSKNILFYSFKAVNDYEIYKIGYVNLDAPELKGIINNSANIPMNFRTFDFDQENSSIYLGGSNGIYKFDLNSKEVVPYNNIWDAVDIIFYKDNIYFVKQDHFEVTVKQGDSFKVLLDSVYVEKFVIYKNDIVVFFNYNGLYVSKGENFTRVPENHLFKDLTVDLNGEVYAWSLFGIYKVIVNKILEKSETVKLSNSLPIGAMTFDNDNRLLFTMKNKVFRLVETKRKKCPKILKHRYLLSGLWTGK